MSERPPQRPEGELIERAQKHSKLSQRQAAPLAGISENRWRNITSGYQTVSAGVYAAVKGPPDTVARMARAVGVTPEQLVEAEREDAAEELRSLPPLEESRPEPDVAELAERVARLEEIVRRLEGKEARADEDHRESVELRRLMEQMGVADVADGEGRPESARKAL